MKIKDFQAKDLKGVHGIYKIESSTNGKFYVGSAVCLRGRCFSHSSELKRGIHANVHLQRAWNKYGEVSFVFSVLEKVSDVTQLIEREQHYIDSLNPEYNICRIAGSRLGVVATDVTRKKLSLSLKGTTHSEDFKEKCRNASTGRLHSEESKLKIGASNKRVCEEKLLQGLTLGRPHTEASKMKISNSNKGRVFSDEHKRRIGIAGRRRAYPIVQFDLEGRFIAEFSSYIDLECLGFSGQSFQDCCRGSLKSYKGYKFSYKKDLTDSIDKGLRRFREVQNER